MARPIDPPADLPVPPVAELGELTRETQRLRETRDDFRRRLHELLGLEASRLRTEIEELDRRCTEAVKRQQEWEQEFPAESPSGADPSLDVDPGVVRYRNVRAWDVR